MAGPRAVSILLWVMTALIWSTSGARQLLTPAWNVASLNWKRAVLASNDYIFNNGYVKKERVERAIDDDEAWLAAHPTRRGSKSELQEAQEPGQ